MHERLAWLSSPDTAMAAVVFTNVWRGIPFFAIMLLAGCSRCRTSFTKRPMSTAPACWPVSGTSPCRCCGRSSWSHRTRIIWTFNYADLIFVMTGGGPANATQITSTYTLLQAYSSLDFGYAGALSVVL
jgi:ABC-type sugar transport systems, permease components